MQEEAFKMNANGVENRKVNWRQVGLFIAMTIVVSWSINLLLALTAGYGGNSVTINSLQLQMLIPAFFAMVLGVFVFQKQPAVFPHQSFSDALVFLCVYAVHAVVRGIHRDSPGGARSDDSD
jgi:hypothetical protein